MARSGGDWGIVGVSLVGPTQRDRLAPQDFAYTALELGPGYEKPQVIDVVQAVLVARERTRRRWSRRWRDPGVRIVSADGDREGSCHEPSTGRPNREKPDIVHDLENPREPRRAPGDDRRGLGARRAAGGRAVHGDSLRQPARGRPVVRDVVIAFAGRDPGHADWIAAEGAFPSTMVDRIVPATKEEDIWRGWRS